MIRVKRRFRDDKRRDENSVAKASPSTPRKIPEELSEALDILLF